LVLGARPVASVAWGETSNLGPGCKTSNSGHERGASNLGPGSGIPGPVTLGLGARPVTLGMRGGPVILDLGVGPVTLGLGMRPLILGLEARSLVV